MIEVLATREYEKGGEKKTAWTKVGIFFPKQGGEPGEGQIILDALPLNGKLVLKVAKARSESVGF